MSSSFTLFKKADSSDYITAKRQMAIAGEYMNTNNTNPVKKNRSTYNKNFKFIQTKAVDLSNCLIESKSYELLQSYKKGVSLSNPLGCKL